LGDIWWWCHVAMGLLLIKISQLSSHLVNLGLLAAFESVKEQLPFLFQKPLLISLA
jgi:hypothetical protein